MPTVTSQTAFHGGVPSSTSAVRRLGMHAPYYWRWLRSLPYGLVRRITKRRAHEYERMEPFFRGKAGLEIGGPSAIFREAGLIPVYGRCRTLHNCNFSSTTIWDGQQLRGAGDGFSCARQYVADATSLREISAESYDFVLASHVLEHVANPLRALAEWKRVLRPGGALLVIVPDHRTTFDCRRRPTSFEHIAADFEGNTPEDDLAHVEEILALHHLGLDPHAGSKEEFRKRCLANAWVRAMHHHVFIPETLVRMFSAVAIKVLTVSVERPCHIVICGQPVNAEEFEETVKKNLGYLVAQAERRKRDSLARGGRAG